MLALLTDRARCGMTPAEVERCLDTGREALVLLAALVINGERSRQEACERARAEHDALLDLLDEAPASEHAKIHDLLLRYEMMIRSLVS
jgi:hypothetical protein